MSSKLRKVMSTARRRVKLELVSAGTNSLTPDTADRFDRVGKMAELLIPLMPATVAPKVLDG
jgi:hypothetical protein